MPGYALTQNSDQPSPPFSARRRHTPRLCAQIRFAPKLGRYLSKHDPGKHQNAKLTLTSISKAEHRDSDDSDDDYTDGLEVNTLPHDGVYIKVGDGVTMLKRVESEMAEGGEKATGNRTESTTLTLSACGGDAEERINRFVDKAYVWYKASLLQKKDNKRYMYMMQHAPVPATEGSEAPRTHIRTAAHAFEACLR